MPSCWFANNHSGRNLRFKRVLPKLVALNSSRLTRLENEAMVLILLKPSPSSAKVQEGQPWDRTRTLFESDVGVIKPLAT